MKHASELNDRELIDTHVMSAAGIFDKVLEVLRQADPKAHEFTMKLLGAGAAMSAKVTAAPSGLTHLSVDLMDARGDSHNLLDMDLTAAAPPLTQ